MSRWAVAVVAVYHFSPLNHFHAVWGSENFQNLLLLLSSSSFIIVILHLLLTQKPRKPHHNFFHLADERLSSFIGFFLFFQLCSRRFKWFFPPSFTFFFFLLETTVTAHSTANVWAFWKRFCSDFFDVFFFVPQRHFVSLTRCRRSNKTSAHFSSCVRRCQRISPRNLRKSLSQRSFRSILKESLGAKLNK